MTKKKSGKTKTGEVSQQAIVYTGSIRAITRGVPKDAEVVRMGYSTGLTGSSVGAQVQISTANVSGCSDWTSFNTVFDEYRVLGFSITWAPRFGDSTSSVNTSEGLVVSTHNPTNPGPFTSYNQMLDYSDWRAVHTGRAFTHEWRMASTEEAQFSTTSGTLVAQGWIIPWFIAATTSSAYGTLAVEFAVQFRGRK